MIDHATSEMLAEFFPSETTVCYLKVMRNCNETKGVFKTLYVDELLSSVAQNDVTSLKCKGLRKTVPIA
jgi:hypothetical protein